MANPLFDALCAPHLGSDAPCLILPEGRVTGYADFLATAARYAHAMAGIGLAPGDRLAVQLDKSPEALAVYAACLQAGVVFLPLNPAYTAAEVAYFVEDAGASALLCPERGRAALGPVADNAGARLDTLGAGGTGGFADRARNLPGRFAPVDRAEGDLAALLYTSGTTGRAKGAMLSQANLLSNARALVAAWRFTADDVLLHALPIFHTHGLFVAGNVAFLSGASMIFLPRFEPEEVLAHLPAATAMMGVPTFYTRLLDQPRFTRAQAAHMRLFTSGSAPLSAADHARFEARTGHRILERYGMTETNMTTSNPYDGERRAGTVGPPLPGVKLRITDPDGGGELAQGAIGRVEVRGPNVFQGYWGMPERTRAEMRADGFFVTGDLGRLDADGYLELVGRETDLVIVGGLNVYPKEIEAVLDDQPGIRESAVIGVAHPDLGEGVVAVLVPEAAAEPDTEALATALGARLARFKLPRRYETLAELPRNTMGKVQKAALRERFAHAFADTR